MDEEFLKETQMLIVRIFKELASFARHLKTRYSPEYRRPDVQEKVRRIRAAILADLEKKSLRQDAMK